MKSTNHYPAGLALPCFVTLILIWLCCSQGNAQSKTSVDKVRERVQRFEPVIANAAKRHVVDPRLLWIIAWLETRFDPNQVSRRGARGMMQFMPITAARYGLTNPHNAGAAIDAAARYVRDLAARFDNRIELMLAAYNSGEETVEAYLTGRTIKAGNKVINPKGIVTGGIPPYPETRAYVAQGLRLLEQFPASSFLSTQQSTPVEKNEEAVGEEPVLQHGVVRKSVRPNLRSEQIEADSPKPISKRSIFFGKAGEQN